MWRPNSPWRALWTLLAVLHETNGLLREALRAAGVEPQTPPVRLPTLPALTARPRTATPPVGPEALTYPEERHAEAARAAARARRQAQGIPE